MLLQHYTVMMKKRQNNDSEQVVHIRASVTKQYNLVLDKILWQFVNGKVNMGVAESNVSLS